MLANYPNVSYGFAPNYQTVRPLVLPPRIDYNFQFPSLDTNYNVNGSLYRSSALELPITQDIFPTDILPEPVSSLIGDAEYSIRTFVKETGILIFATIILLIGLYGAVR